MLILGIETATQQVGCAIGGHEGVRAGFQAAHGRRHVETLVPAIDFVCRHAGVALKEISAVAVDVGPGLFSGLRVGVSAGKAVAQALRVPVIGVTSLDLLAFPVRHSSRLIVAAVDARRGELFYAFYRQVPGGVQRLSGYNVGSPAQLASELEATGEECLFVGDGALRYPSLVAEAVHCESGGVSAAHPSATALVELAHPLAIREEFVQPWELEPLYLRRSDAEINWERRTPPDWAATA
ncbi:MAG: tRNA threonylcarbamoyladenosine biosynthesis protein TsaB [Acidimicrobiaceae bacterium]